MQKLLLADDSVTIQRVIELTFSGEDIQVIAVNDGEQAIARIPSERPDIVLADIGMPKKGGYDVAAFVKGRVDLEHIPVLLLAGAFEPVDQARAEQVRCDGVLIKPFEPRQVIERVRELLEGAKGSPAQATADVPRPVERLSPRAEPASVPVVPSVAAVAVQAPPPASPSPVAVAAPPASAADAALESDLALDEYFESLNSAFDSVGHAGASTTAAPERPPVFDAPPADPDPRQMERRSEPSEHAPHARRRGDSLDEYFDRLSTAFEHAKPSGPAHELPDGFDELLEEPVVPTVETLVTRSAGIHEGNGHGSPSPAGASGRLNGHGEPSRNPIVAALEAMLAVEEPAPSVPEQPTLPGLPDGWLHMDDEPPARSDLAEAVTHRVLGRLLPEITATVQRLVKEEVDRIRRHH